MINAHDKRNHGGIYATTYFINQNNLYWINMTRDIKNHISNCLTCMKINKNNKNTLSTSKTILSRGPRDRYVADLWHLPPELNSKYTNYKYVLDICDHFSKYTNSFLLNSKESYEIYPLIKNFMINNGFPKYLITDNGTEFKNKLIKEFCENNHVKIIHGLPYRPHSQGVVERIHRIIKKGLLCHKEDLKDKYNINYSIDDVITIKNNTICRVTKKCPNEIFNDENIGQEEIKRINDLMIKSQKSCNIFKNTYDIGEKIFINNNIKLSYNTLKKNNKKIGLWNIHGEIIKIYSGGSYKIKILKDENKYFNVGDEYYTNFRLLKKLNDKDWKKLNEDYQQNYNKHIEDIYGKVNNKDFDYGYSSADDSGISDSEFGLSEDEELINKNIKSSKVLYIKKHKV